MKTMVPLGRNLPSTESSVNVISRRRKEENQMRNAVPSVKACGKAVGTAGLQRWATFTQVVMYGSFS
jgi:hypothetical protein